MAMMMNEDFQYVLRILNTNVDGRQKVMYAMCTIKGIGRRLSNLICKKADIDTNKRAGELTNDEVDRIITIVQNPRQFKIPDWFLNRQKDNKDGKYSQVKYHAHFRVASLDVSVFVPCGSCSFASPCPQHRLSMHWFRAAVVLGVGRGYELPRGAGELEDQGTINAALLHHLLS